MSTIVYGTSQKDSVRWAALLKLAAHPGAGIQDTGFLFGRHKTETIQWVREFLAVVGQVDNRSRGIVDLTQDMGCFLAHTFDDFSTGKGGC